MIEINKKAKQADPWDTPPLDLAGFHAARDAGKLLWLHRFDQEVGMFRPYDCIPAQRAASPDAFILEKWLSKPAAYQIRAHADHRVVVYQPYYDPCGSVYGGGFVAPLFVTSPTREKLDTRIVSIKALHPDYLFEGSPQVFTVKTTQERKVIYAAA